MRKLIDNDQLIIPAGNYFVLGDNRNDSEDSRYWGFVPREAIVGKTFLIYFSLNNSAPTPGQAAAAAMPGSTAPPGHPTSPGGSLLNFARWDRTLRIIH